MTFLYIIISLFFLFIIWIAYEIKHAPLIEYDEEYEKAYFSGQTNLNRRTLINQSLTNQIPKDKKNKEAK